MRNTAIELNDTQAHTFHRSNVLEYKETVVPLLKRPKNDPSAPAFTDRPVVTSAQPENCELEVDFES